MLTYLSLASLSLFCCEHPGKIQDNNRPGAGEKVQIQNQEGWNDTTYEDGATDDNEITQLNTPESDG